MPTKTICVTVFNTEHEARMMGEDARYFEHQKRDAVRQLAEKLIDEAIVVEHKLDERTMTYKTEYYRITLQVDGEKKQYSNDRGMKEAETRYMRYIRTGNLMVLYS